MNKGKKIVIIGGVAAGASAAAKAARTDKEAEVILFEKGPYISFANCGLPYFISGEVDDRGKLIVRRPEQLNNQYGIHVYVNTEVTAINRPTKTVTVYDHLEKQERKVDYDKLIIAVGGKTFLPPIPGLDAPNVFTLRSIPDVDSIDDFIREHHPKKAAVLGAGYIGIESADVLRKRGLETTIFEMQPHVLPPFDYDVAEMFEKRIEKTGVNLINGDAVAEIEKDERGRAVRVRTRNGAVIETDLVIASLGIRPRLKLAKDAGLETGEFGIVVDDHMRTSDPDIYAAGDVVELKHVVTGMPTWSPLAGPAGWGGKIAGGNAAGENKRFRGVLGTSIVKYDELAGAKTGLSEKEAEAAGIDYISVIVRAKSHAGYYPGAKSIFLKVLARKPTGKIIGAQAVGEEGIDKRIDVLATAITGGMTADDLEHLDLAYAPQFSTTIDAVNVAGSKLLAKLS